MSAAAEYSRFSGAGNLIINNIIDKRTTVLKVKLHQHEPPQTATGNLQRE
jgi:hypothetical protein